MKHFTGRKMILVLLLLLYISTPVCADTLSGDENGRAAGQTSVTARIELPEDYEPGGSEDAGSSIDTGDDTQIFMYIFMILLSGILVISALRAKTRIR